MRDSLIPSTHSLLAAWTKSPHRPIFQTDARPKPHSINFCMACMMNIVRYRIVEAVCIRLGVNRASLSYIGGVGLHFSAKIDKSTFFLNIAYEFCAGGRFLNASYGQLSHRLVSQRTILLAVGYRGKSLILAYIFLVSHHKYESSFWKIESKKSWSLFPELS